MATTLDPTALAAVLKTQYTQSKVNNLCYNASPVFAAIKKKTDFVGANKVVAFQYGSPQGRAADFSTGLTNVNTSAYAKVTVTRVKDYAFGRVDGEAVDAAGTDAGALLNALKKEIDNAMYTAARSIATSMFRNGGGARGQISTGSTVSTANITLSNINDVTNFEVGMILNLGSTDGTSGSKRSGTVTLTGVNRSTGVLTASGNWTAGIAAAATSDYIFQNGDFEAANSMLAGLAAWIPTTDPTATTFFGLDRSVDPTRLGGLRYTANAGGSIEETLIKCSALLAREGGRPDMVALNPIDLGSLVVNLGSKVVYDRMGSSDEPAIGFKSVQLMGAAGPIDVVADMNCPSGGGWMLTKNTWSFETLKGAPRILNLDGNDMRASATADSYIFRIGYYGNLICEAPGYNAYFQL